jgi:hypothetical protein
VKDEVPRRGSAEGSLGEYSERPSHTAGQIGSDANLLSASLTVKDDNRVCEDSSRLVCEKTRAHLLQSSRFHHLCRFISWESEELDERPHALFLTAARKSLGSCQLGDTMEARPKQFRYNL